MKTKIVLALLSGLCLANFQARGTEPAVEEFHGTGQSAAVVRAGGSLEIVYTHEALRSPVRLPGDEAGLECVSGCRLPVDGTLVSFRSAAGLERVRQLAASKAYGRDQGRSRALADRTAAVGAGIGRATRLASAGLSFSDQERGASASENSGKASVEPKAFNPVTLSIAGGFGDAIDVIDRNPATLQVETLKKTPGNVSVYLRIPAIPRRDHGVGSVGLSFGPSVTIVKGDQDDWVEGPSHLPYPGSLDYAATKASRTQARKGAVLWEPARIDWTTPQVGNFSGYVGAGLVVGHNDQRLITDDVTRSWDGICVERIVDDAGVTLGCNRRVSVNEISVATHRVYDNAVNWSGIGHSVFAGVSARLSRFASLFAEWDRLSAGQKIDTFKVGVNITVWPVK
ncbi:MAG: hypothetical protein HY551_04495 [Elusimicrobia bacterium]|nr:hypothetical protein [Elusimicrobiota bacterium]